MQSHLQHYTEPSADPTPVSSSLSSTLLPLGPGTLTHNSSGVPIIVACTKADLIDEGHDLAAGSSGMGGMVKGKGGEWEERTDGVMQVLRTICLKCMDQVYVSVILPLMPFYRRSSFILYNTDTNNTTCAAAVCFAPLIYATCSFARNGIRRCSRARS